MKRSKLIKLVSLLLCAVLFLAACGEEAPEGPSADETPSQTVDPVFKNYFNLDHKTGVESLTEAIRFDGEVIDVFESHNVSLLLVRKTRIDVMNRVCEAFSVYNVDKGEVLSPKNDDTFDNEYDRVGVIPENILSADEIPSSTVSVSFLDVDGILPLVAVRTHKVEKIEDEEKKEDDKIVGEYVTVSDTYVYYDVLGNEICTAETSSENGIPTAEESGYGIKLVVGKNTAMFDPYTFECVEIVNNEIDTAFVEYSYVNDKYYYYFNTTPMGGSIDVFDKSGNLVLERTLYDPFTAFALDNGDVVVQKRAYILDDKAEGDVMINDEYYDLSTYVISVSDGKETEVEFDYMIMSLYDVSMQKKLRLPTTENTKNLIVAFDISRKLVSSSELRFVVVDNSMKISYVTEELYPIQTDPLSMETVSSGYVAIGLSAVTDRAILDSNGNAVAFLESGDTVLDGMVVTGKAVYNYSLQPLYNYEVSGVNLVTTVGNSVIVVTKPSDDPLAAYTPTYYKLTLGADGKIVSETVFGPEYIYVGTTDSVIVMQNTENGKYTVFNSKCEHILTTQYVLRVIENNGQYIVLTLIDGKLNAYSVD